MFREIKTAKRSAIDSCLFQFEGANTIGEAMIANRNFGKSEPLTWVGRFPVYLATALAGVQLVAMILTSLAMAVGGAPEGNAVLNPLLFSFPAVLANGSVWRFFTYAFVIPPSLWTLVSIVMFAWFGRDVETFLGRRSFAWLCGLLVLSISILLAVLTLMGFPMGPYFGSGAVSFAVFLAFVMIYPRAQFFFGLEARWIAMAFLGLNSLILLAGHGWVELMLMWWTAGMAALWLRFEGVARLQTPSIAEVLRHRHSKKNLRVLPAASEREKGVHESIDPILEKIARRGIGSLTRGERDQLEQARTALLAKERRN